MVSELIMGFDESTLAYDLQRAHSADIWFLRARFYFWSFVACIASFMFGHSLSQFGIDLYSSLWNGIWNVWFGLW
jgi:hypothetical protein